MIKILLYGSLAAGLFFDATSCQKRNFYPEPDHPGLSRFTAYGYNVVTEYINGFPYINPFSATRGNYPPTFQLIKTSSTFDSLSISWEVEPNDTSQAGLFEYEGISLSIPVAKSFNKQDFLALSGERLDSNNASLQTEAFYDPTGIFGTANIYFVQITLSNAQNGLVYYCSGLFNGAIQNSVVVTDGRFDFQISANELNF